MRAGSSSNSLSDGPIRSNPARWRSRARRRRPVRRRACAPGRCKPTSPARNYATTSGIPNSEAIEAVNKMLPALRSTIISSKFARQRKCSEHMRLHYRGEFGIGGFQCGPFQVHAGVVHQDRNWSGDSFLLVGQGLEVVSNFVTSPASAKAFGPRGRGPFAIRLCAGPRNHFRSRLNKTFDDAQPGPCLHR